MWLPEMTRNPISTPSDKLSLNFFGQKGRKKNYPPIGGLEPQPTSKSKWVGEPDYVSPGDKQHAASKAGHSNVWLQFVS